MKRLGLCMFLGMALTSMVFSITVDEIVKKANHVSYYAGNDGKAKVSMTISDSQERERKRQFSILRLDIDNEQDTGQKFYVYFERPSDVRKTAFLVWKHLDQDDDRWLYLPALDLVKRVAASDKRTSFVGSDFYYEDVSGRNPYEDQHELIEENEDYYILKSVPKDPASVEFTSYKSWIHKASFIPVKIEYVDAQDNKIRTYTALGVETIQGFPTVTSSRMDNHKLGSHTVLTYENVQYNVGLEDDVFTERYLRNAPRRLLR